ncbi:myc-associated zinc finger protein-like isoform 1-T1 [Salvelinus alpinus]|uniref:myc-associated zinc finger protein isoform X1 n=1 Tax=Salvelinus sp. IW2-2015 TaxID=2691554 RepID=UPI000CDFEA9C|nr:myc-associated zinc finger protein isoform X1 [Salvelinus alpinus]
MDAAWSNFLFQTTPTQNQVEGTLQSELLPVHMASPQTPPTEHIIHPPSTVDTAALNEEPLPVKTVSRPARVPHICAICSKQFKNNYNLRRHQSVHTGVRMKRAGEQEEGAKEGGNGAGPAQVVSGGRTERYTVPLTLLHLSVPPPLPPPRLLASQQPTVGSQDGEEVAMASVVASVNPHAPPAAVDMGAGATVQRPSNPNPVRKNHACETCGKAFRDVYHLNRHRLSHSDEKPFSCPICQQRFKRKDRMSHHVRSHQGGVEKPYVCPHCAKAFSRPDHLNSHVRQVHSSERPFKCPVLDTCESSFATRDRLRAHMIRHEEKVPCHICGKLLSAAYITDHMRVHNQSQHHACHLCNRSFTTLTYLRVHAQKHHGQEWKESAGVFGGTSSGGVLVCQLCGVHCKTPTQLQGHMGTHSTGGQGGSPGPVTSSGASSSSVSLGNMVSAPNFYVSGNTVVDLLVSDCSSIQPQSHS